jgi:hypothetical protein
VATALQCANRRRAHVVVDQAQGVAIAISPSFVFLIARCCLPGSWLSVISCLPSPTFVSSLFRALRAGPYSGHALRCTLHLGFGSSSISCDTGKLKKAPPLALRAAAAPFPVSGSISLERAQGKGWGILKAYLCWYCSKFQK